MHQKPCLPGPLCSPDLAEFGEGTPGTGNGYKVKEKGREKRQRREGEGKGERKGHGAIPAALFSRLPALSKW